MIVGSLLFVGLLSACASSLMPNGTPVSSKSPFVRKVDFSETPDMKNMAERAREIGNEVYPQILSLLTDDASRSPRRFDIIFKRHIDFRNTTGYQSGAYAIGTKIYVGADWAGKSPNDFEIQLVHEIAHVAQNYHDRSRVPSFWTEGIADFLRFKLGYTNDWSCPQCSPLYPHYTDGYTCAGALLLYIDGGYGLQVVRQLNQALRRASYSEDFFVRTTGKGLKDLWSEFKETPSLTAAAAEILKLEESLGYQNGQPPAGLDTLSISQVQRARAEAFVRQQPGGALWQEALAFLTGLKENGRLPGWSSAEQEDAMFQAYVFDLQKAPAEPGSYPYAPTILCNKKADACTYHYTVIRPSKQGAWKLQKAWRTAPDGRVIEEYPVPKE